MLICRVTSSIIISIKTMTSIHQFSDTIKHTVDLVLIPAGVAVAGFNVAHFADFVQHVINPLLSAAVLVVSLIWGIYRLKDRKNKNGDKE